MTAMHALNEARAAWERTQPQLVLFPFGGPARGRQQDSARLPLALSPSSRSRIQLTARQTGCATAPRTPTGRTDSYHSRFPVLPVTP